MMQLIDRIELTAAVACDERLPERVRIAAADEVYLFAGPELVRQVVNKYLIYRDGCFHGPGGECRCDDWQALLELVARQNEIWPDAMDWQPE
jgi:hypothetical protein